MSTSTELEVVTRLYRTSNLVTRELDRRLDRSHGVTIVQSLVLMAITRLDRPQPNLIARQLSQQSQTITGVLDRLEAAGLVERLRDLHDRRAVRIELTKVGAKVAKAIEVDLQKYATELFRGYGDKNIDALLAELDEVESKVSSGFGPR